MIPPEIDNYEHPMSLIFQVHNEPAYALTSMQFLREYQPETPGMQKAKNFWLKARKYDLNPSAREEIRRQYPDEVAALRRLVWIQHNAVYDEDMISGGYFRKQRDPNSFVIPASFANLEDYFQFEPEEGSIGGMSNAIRHFLNASKPNGQPWQMRVEDFRIIQANHPDKFERLKELLWQRHVVCEEDRAELMARGLEEARSYFRNQKPMIIVITAISIIATTTFMGAAIIASQPLLFIPSAVFLVAAMATPSIYQYRKSFYE